MTKVVGVRFREAGKIHYFTPGKFDLKINDKVIAETSRGVEYGRVVTGLKDIKEEVLDQSLISILRLVTVEDRRLKEELTKKEKEAITICKEKVRKHDLEMKVIDAEFTFDGNKLMFYFTADGRIDFRELVKDLASVFRTRIELRQIGVRDETKILGGIGVCGRELCCNKYLSDFSPVSIKMAKNQNLSLNPTKISGVCGRLMCCLSNEEETYQDLNSTLPAVGETVKDSDGLKGEVLNVSILRQQVKVLTVNKSGEKEIKYYKVEELTFQNSLKQQINEEVHDITERGHKNNKQNKHKKDHNTKDLKDKVDMVDKSKHRSHIASTEQSNNNNKTSKHRNNKDTKPNREKLAKNTNTRSNESNAKRKDKNPHNNTKVSKNETINKNTKIKTDVSSHESVNTNINTNKVGRNISKKNISLGGEKNKPNNFKRNNKFTKSKISNESEIAE